MIDLNWLHDTNTNGKSLIEMRYYELSLLFTAINNCFKKNPHNIEWCLIRNPHLFLYINHIKFLNFEVSIRNFKISDCNV